MHVTLQDVARLANVSAKTVSRVVNNQGEISEATRQRVQEAIEKLGYRPNILARSLVNQRSAMLGVVASGLEYFGPSRTVTGIEQRSYELGYSLLFSLMPQAADTNVQPVLDSLVARRVDGIIWAVSEIGDNRSWIRPELLADLPPVVFLTMAPRPGLSIVAVDNRAGATRATRHLVDLGRRKLGVITGPLSWWEARERLDGFTGALRQAGLELAPAQVVEGDWTAISGKAGMQQLLEQFPDMDAVFACNDQMALGALGVVHQAGCKIPEDIAFIGFDNIPESPCFWPPLSTVEQHLDDAGSIAVQMLQELIAAQQRGQDDQVTEVRMLDTDLFIRESSAGIPVTEAS